MAYNAKTNWAIDNIVLPADMNRIEQGIKDVDTGKARLSHTHTIANITGLQSALDGKASSSHSHSISNITGLQNALDAKASSTHIHTLATSASQGFMSSSDKVKLDGISNKATETYVTDELSSTSSTIALSANQGRLLKGMIDGKAPSIHAHTNATTSSAGFMSTADKEKLDGIATGATNTVIINNLDSISPFSALSAAQGKILNTKLENLVTSMDGKAGREVATTTANGLMSSSDKVKLNGIQAGATKTTLTDAYNGDSSATALSQYGGKSLFSDLKLRGNIRHTAKDGTQYIKQWIESTGASTTNNTVLSSGQSITIALSTGGYLPPDAIFLSSTLTNSHEVYLDNMRRIGAYAISARVTNISGATFNYLEGCEWNILYSYQRS